MKLIESTELLNKSIYSIIVLFFSILVWCGKTLYNSNIDLQNQMQEMSRVMQKLTFTIDNTNNLFSEFKIEIKDIKKQVNKNERDIAILKEKMKFN